jgi:hypothetical protein
MDFPTLSNDDIISMLAVAISLLSFTIVLWHNKRKAKSDQFKFALDLNDRIERIDDKISDLIERFNRSAKSDDDRKSFLDAKEDLSSEKLNTLVFLSLLISNNEITNKSIIKHFKPTLIEDTKYLFKEYSELEKDDEKYEELKKLLARFENG